MRRRLAVVAFLCDGADRDRGAVIRPRGSRSTGAPAAPSAPYPISVAPEPCTDGSPDDGGAGLSRPDLATLGAAPASPAGLRAGADAATCGETMRAVIEERVAQEPARPPFPRPADRPVCADPQRSRPATEPR